jgi:DNA polymerase III subunit delta'
MEHVLGQARAIEVLQSALQTGRLHHAYIFHGPAGVGKFTTACAFAKILLCHDPQTDLTGQVRACGACESCRLLAAAPASGNDGKAGHSEGTVASAHPDFHVITKELAAFSDDRDTRIRKLTTIPVQVLRAELVGPVGLSARLRHGKLFIIDEAELLAPVGQNILLKTLEEPPPDTYLILVTSREDALLPTIRSRCQRVGFGPLDDAIINDWVDRQKLVLPESNRRWLLNFAAGSLGRAALAVEYDLFAWAKTVLTAIQEMRRGAFPTALGGQMAQMIDGFAKAWVDAHAQASKEAANRQAAGLMWSLISQYARGQLAKAAEAGGGGDPDATEATLAPWLAVIDALSEAERELATNVNLGIVCDHLASRMGRALGKKEAVSL